MSASGVPSNTLGASNTPGRGNTLQPVKKAKAQIDVVDLVTSSSESGLDESQDDLNHTKAPGSGKKSATLSGNGTIRPRDGNIRNGSYAGSGGKILYRAEDGSSKTIAINGFASLSPVKQVLQDVTSKHVDSGPRSPLTTNEYTPKKSFIQFSQSPRSTPRVEIKDTNGRVTPSAKLSPKNPAGKEQLTPGTRIRSEKQRSTTPISYDFWSNKPQKSSPSARDGGFPKSKDPTNGLRSLPSIEGPDGNSFRGASHARPWEATSRTPGFLSNSRTPVRNDISRESSRLSSVSSSHASEIAPQSQHTRSLAIHPHSPPVGDRTKRGRFTASKSSEVTKGVNTARRSSSSQPPSSTSRTVPISETLKQLADKAPSALTALEKLQVEAAKRGPPESSQRSKPHRQSTLAWNSKPTRETSRSGDPIAEKAKDEAPMAYEAFRLCLKGHLDSMRDDHAYLVKASLKKARHSHHPKPSMYMQANSPFADMKSCKVESTIKTDVSKFGHYIKNMSERSIPAPTLYQITKYKQAAPTIPPYTNYISTKRSVLTEDDKQRTFFPHHEDDFQVPESDEDYLTLELKIEENQERYHKLNKLQDQARSHQQYTLTFLEDIGCSPDAVQYYLLDETGSKAPKELPSKHSADWELRTSYLEDDYYEVKDDQEALDGDDSSDDLQPQKRWRDRFEMLQKPSGKELAAACLACKVFQDMTGFSLFHIVSSIVADTESSDDKYSLNTYVELGCFLCKSHACPGHGEYRDDDEGEHICERVKFKIGSPTSDVGVDTYRVNDLPAHQLLGLDDDGEEVSGESWTTFCNSGHPGFEDLELCSDDCFWPRSARTIVLSKWSEDDEKAFDLLRHAYEFERRGPCLMAQTGIIRKPCKEIFLRLLYGQSEVNRYSSKIINGLKAPNTTFPPRKTLEQWLDDDHNAMSYKVDSQEPFTPCDHLGPCGPDTDCDCYRQGIHCEKSCACASSCNRRYQGCKCKAAARACRTEKCECRRLNRECDPDLCGTCGADEVLDPCNRHNDEILIGRCNNVSIQRGVPKRTLLGSSKLMSSAGKSGWGLYMGEECRKDDFIGEYCGEIITQAESNQRGVIYDQRDLSYLFTLNAAQTIDGTQLGNKIRFINHQGDSTSNCYAKLRLCNGSVRIGMFASRDIAIAEELFFNYGEEFASKFELIKLQADGSISIGKSRKPAPQTLQRSERSTPQQIEPNDGRNTYYQLKNRTSKNGHRLGRPPKDFSQDKDSQSRYKKRNLAETLESGLSDPPEESAEESTGSAEDFDEFAIPSEEEEPPEKRRRITASIDSDDSDSEPHVTRRSKRVARSTRSSQRSQSANIRRHRTTTENSQRNSQRSHDTSHQSSQQSRHPNGQWGSLRSNPNSKSNSQLSSQHSSRPANSQIQGSGRNQRRDIGQDEKEDSPRRSQRRRLEKLHFDGAGRSQSKESPVRVLRTTARKRAR